jgi:hypothetical protein
MWVLVQPLGYTVLAADTDFPAASFGSCRISRAGIPCKYRKKISFGLSDAAHERGGNGCRTGTENELTSGRFNRRADSFQVTQQTGRPTHISVSLPGGTVSSTVA